MLRQNQRALTKAMRELDRERAKMEQQEKKIIADIKKMAKQGQMDAVKIMAKVRQIVAMQCIKSFYKMLSTCGIYLVMKKYDVYPVFVLGFGSDKAICQKIYVNAS